MSKSKLFCAVVLCVALLTACLSMPTATAQPVEPGGSVTPSPAPSVTPTATVTPSVCVVRAAALHVRAGPGVEYAVVDWLVFGESKTVLNQRGGWYDIGAGWVNSNFCK